MSALAAESGSPREAGWDEIVRVWEETDAPEGSKVEIIEGVVTVPPPPSKDHNTTAALLQRRLYTKIPEAWEIYQTLGLEVPGSSDLFVPDLAVLPVEAVLGAGNRVPADEAELVVEITSKRNANHDRIKKVHGYARAGVPLYLLLDPGIAVARQRRSTEHRRTAPTASCIQSSTARSSLCPRPSSWTSTRASSL